MQLLFFLLEALFAAVLFTVLTSFAICWYEKANARPELIESRFSLSVLKSTLGMLLLETASLFGTLLIHPLGYIPLRHKPCPQGATPIILLHGLFQNRICWWWFALSLKRRGLGPLYSLNLPPWKDVESLTERLANLVDRLKLDGGGGRVILIGHSMGGLIGRNYLQIRGGATKVQQLITLGSPHGGSRLAPFAVSKMGKDLLPGSGFLQNLRQAPLPEGVSLIAIYSRHDNLVLPAENGRVEGAQNIEVRGIGHMGLLYHPRILELVVESLKAEKG